MELKDIISSIIYLIVGLISLKMAWKNMSSKRLISFNEKISNTPWDEVDENLRRVILSMMKIIGVGFLIVGMMLFMEPIVLYFTSSLYMRSILPILSITFSFGLLFINYNLQQKTDRNTPWKLSLVSVIMLITGLILSII